MPTLEWPRRSCATFGSASHNGRGLWLCGFLTASTRPQRRCTPCRAPFSAFSAAHFLASCLFHTNSFPSGSSRRRDEKPRPLHVHRHRDELKVAVVAIQAEIANLRHPIPVLHRRVRTLDADANARRRLVEPDLPVAAMIVASTNERHWREDASHAYAADRKTGCPGGRSPWPVAGRIRGSGCSAEEAARRAAPRREFGP